jgi:arginyl-tRNA synthetase
VITGDLSVAVAAAAAAAVAAGEFSAGPLTSADVAGTWRPGPGDGPGCYATSVPLRLARPAGPDAAQVAAALAARLPPGAGLSQAAVTGRGYLTLSVTPVTLAGLAVRISQAGPGCARSPALLGSAVTVAAHGPLGAARSWPEAARWLTAGVTGRCAAAAGAEVRWPAPARAGPGQPGPVTAPAVSQTPGGTGVPAGPVADAIAFAGRGAIQFALSLAAPGHHRVIDPRAAAAPQLGNPAYAVRYAHAHAASTVRQAADLGLPMGAAERFQPRLLTHPTELALLDALSWFPERVAGAARRHQPHAVAGYLTGLAGTYFHWQEGCPVSRPGAFPAGPPGQPGAPPRLAARLWLADAARTVLGTGLGLLGVAAPGPGQLALSGRSARKTP